MQSWITKKEDSHKVYSQLLPHLEGLQSAIIIRRWGCNLTSRFYAVRWGLALLGDIVAIKECISLKNKLIFVREFSGWSWFLLGPWLRILNPSAKIFLNVNHNLNNSIERDLLLPILSFLFNVVFIEPSSVIIKKYSWLRYVRLNKSLDHQPQKIKHAYFFLGNRVEQIILSYQDLYLLIRKVHAELQFTIIGGGIRRLSYYQYRKALNPSSLVVILYSSDAYSERHSGVVLQALISGCTLVMFDGELACNYAHRGFPVITIQSIEDLPGVVDSILKRKDSDFQ